MLNFGGVPIVSPLWNGELISPFPPYTIQPPSDLHSLGLYTGIALAELVVVVIGTPARRIFAVKSESRVFCIKEEKRIFVIDGDN